MGKATPLRKLKCSKCYKEAQGVSRFRPHNAPFGFNDVSVLGNQMVRCNRCGHCWKSTSYQAKFSTKNMETQPDKFKELLQLAHQLGGERVVNAEKRRTRQNEFMHFYNGELKESAELMGMTNLTPNEKAAVVFAFGLGWNSEVDFLNAADSAPW